MKKYRVINASNVNRGRYNAFPNDVFTIISCNDFSYIGMFNHPVNDFLMDKCMMVLYRNEFNSVELLTKSYPKIR